MVILFSPYLDFDVDVSLSSVYNICGCLDSSEHHSNLNHEWTTASSACITRSLITHSLRLLEMFYTPAGNQPPQTFPHYPVPLTDSTLLCTPHEGSTLLWNGQYRSFPTYVSISEQYISHTRPNIKTIESVLSIDNVYHAVDKFKDALIASNQFVLFSLSRNVYVVQVQFLQLNWFGVELLLNRVGECLEPDLTLRASNQLFWSATECNSCVLWCTNITYQVWKTHYGSLQLD